MGQDLSELLPCIKPADLFIVALIIASLMLARCLTPVCKFLLDHHCPHAGKCPSWPFWPVYHSPALWAVSVILMSL